MKFAKPNQNWTKRFAWFPVRTNTGANNCHQRVWLESYYVRTQTTMGKPELVLMSKDDYRLAIGDVPPVAVEQDD